VSTLVTDIVWLPVTASDRTWRRLAAPVSLPNIGQDSPGGGGHEAAGPLSEDGNLRHQR